MGTGGHTDAGEGTWIPAFAGNSTGWTGGEWRDLWELAGIRTPGRGRGFRLSPERRVGSGGVYGNWRAYGRRRGDVDSGFRRKDGLGVAGLWQLAGIRTPGRGRGFRLLPERRVGSGGVYGNWRAYGRRGGDVDSGFRRKDGLGVAVSMATGGHTDAGEGTYSGFCRKTGSGGTYGNSWVFGHRGRDVDSGFRRKDGWGMAGPMAVRGYSAIGEGTWIPAFAGKTELGHRGGDDVGCGFRWKDGSGGCVYGNRRAWRNREGTWIPAFDGIE